jgi:hypothetical protein
MSVSIADIADDEGPMSPAFLRQWGRCVRWRSPTILRRILMSLERKLNQHGIDHADMGIEDVFRKKRFIVDNGIAALHLDRKRGAFERAAVELARGNQSWGVFAHR